MSWWNRKSRQGNMVRLPRLDASNFNRIGDPNCVACYIRNDSPVQLDFVSTLELQHPSIIEADAWKGFVLQPGQKKLVPHRYWDIFPRNADRTISVIEIPKDHEPVEFLYKTRVIEKGNAAEDLHSLSGDSDTPPLGAEPPAKASLGKD